MTAGWRLRSTPMLHDYVHHAAQDFPEREALVAGPDRLTWEELEQRTNALANAYLKLGVKKGDRVHLYLENEAETVIAWWAAMKANAIPSVLNPLTKGEKLAWYLNDARASLLVAEAQLTPFWTEAARKAPHLKQTLVVRGFDAERTKGLNAMRFEEALALDDGESPPDRAAIDADLAAIVYTSGTTGEPKGTMLTHRNMLHASTVLTQVLKMNERDVVLSALTLAFNYGMYHMILTAQVGAKLVLERSFAYPMKVLERIAQERATGFPGVPTMYALLGGLKTDQTFPSMRYLTNTAAALTPKHIDVLERLFPNAKIYSMYGLTECKRCCCLPPEDLKRKPDSVGLPLPNSELWLVDDQGQRLEGKPGEVGELVVRGSNVMKGYWEKPEATAKALKPGPLPNEVVFHTGDLFRFDAEGYLYFVARKDDVIKSRGEKVAPVEVETALTEVAGVKEAAVIGVPDELLGHAVKAFVVLEAGVQLSERELQKQVAARLELFMVPKQIVFLDALPKTQTGKISKAGLR